jgi:type IV pilus assembly protein PilA
MKKNMQGFTLIELMIVVAIIAILAAIAISQYQDYVIRSQVSEGSALADGVKTAVAEFYQNKGWFASVNASAGLAASTSIEGNYVDDVNVASGGTRGVIGATYESSAPKEANANIDADVLLFSAVTHAGSIEWNCKSTTIKQKWCASSCVCSG